MTFTDIAAYTPYIDDIVDRPVIISGRGGKGSYGHFHYVSAADRDDVQSIAYVALVTILDRSMRTGYISKKTNIKYKVSELSEESRIKIVARTLRQESWYEIAKHLGIAKCKKDIFDNAPISLNTLSESDDGIHYSPDVLFNYQEDKLIDAMLLGDSAELYMKKIENKSYKPDLDTLLFISTFQRVSYQIGVKYKAEAIKSKHNVDVWSDDGIAKGFELSPVSVKNRRRKIINEYTEICRQLLVA